MTVTNGANGEHGNAQDVDFRDPAVYTEYATKWPSIPDTEAGWLRRAQEVADVLAVDAVTRDQENKSPRAEVALLKHSGLLKILGPSKFGGGGQPWSIGEPISTGKLHAAYSLTSSKATRQFERSPKQMGISSLFSFKILH
jgi:hypothetical protein